MLLEGSAIIRYETVSRHKDSGDDIPDKPGKKIDLYRKNLKKAKIKFTEEPVSPTLYGCPAIQFKY
jgi:cobalamin biosynthesis protein CobT